MQPEELKKEYINKLDELIEYFTTEKEQESYHFNQIKEDNKFYFSIFLSLYAILIVISNMFISYNAIVGLLYLLILISLLTYVLYVEPKKSNLFNKKYIKKSIGYETVINFLQYLKISQIEVDLSPLINKIEQRYRDNRILMIDNYDEIWIKEMINSLDIINNKIIIGENN